MMELAVELTVELARVVLAMELAVELARWVLAMLPHLVAVL